MSTSDCLLIAAGYVLCALAGVVTGGVGVFKIFQTLHNDSLPPKG